ncbi:hypothetical protein [Alkalicoccobacillus plakortidis]|uniref:DUF4367 domain-containing protein n=1 Tax=Alkalicoccobacillus plakortidis TaxID=444060 RepID=A0ABT0XFB0_9BACI|nr:hypothetical protein [Alkalicoccobacillus plakortidis]MCM2674490.1 hypothetical protein [Alkalicoccobacillus plakortidis]
MNEFKRELEEIKIPDELSTRSKMGVKKAKGEQKKTFKKPLVYAAAIVILSVSIYSTPSAQGMFEDLFQVTKFEERHNVKEMSIGYGFVNTDVYAERNVESIEELESLFNIQVPFPEVLESAIGKEDVEYSVGMGEQGEFKQLYYNAGTAERRYSVHATNNIDTKPSFSAESKDGTGIEKDLLIDGVTAKLMGIEDIDGKVIYLEKDEWKIIITCFDRNSDNEGLSGVEEEEIIEIAESINWF